MNGTTPALVRVWDPLVRVGHWALVAGFAVAYATGDELVIHAPVGYAVGLIILARIAWGFVGPRYARFSDFLYSPAQVLGYLRDLLLFRARRYLGHSPGGGAMVIALLLFLAATVLTGLVLYGEDNHAGPLAPLFASAGQAPGGALVKPAAADEKERRVPNKGKTEDKVLEEAHELLANITLALIVAHILGVALASIVHRENLLAAMITGRKRANSSS